MSYLAVDLAIFERLVGAPLDRHGNPKTDEDGIPVNRLIVAPPTSELGRIPSYGARIPLLKSARDGRRGPTRKSQKPFLPYQDWNFHSSKSVPVFPINLEGMKWPEVWPAITYYWIDEEFNADTFLYADPFCNAESTAPDVPVTNRNDKVIAEGPDRLAFRAMPDGYDLIYVIRAYSKDFSEMKWTCDAIRKLFPARGVLEVEQASGEKLAFDMLLERIDNLDEGGQEIGRSLEENDERAFSRGFVYRIESYVDNTSPFDTGASWEGDTILTRILELANLQGQLLETTLINEIEPNPS